MNYHILANTLDNLSSVRFVVTREPHSDDYTPVPGHLDQYLSIYFKDEFNKANVIDVDKNTGKLYIGGIPSSIIPFDIVGICNKYKENIDYNEDNRNNGSDSMNKVIEDDIKKLANDITKKRIADKKSKLGKKILKEVEAKFQIKVSDSKKDKDSKKSNK